MCESLFKTKEPTEEPLPETTLAKSLREKLEFLRRFTEKVLFCENIYAIRSNNPSRKSKIPRGRSQLQQDIINKYPEDFILKIINQYPEVRCCQEFISLLETYRSPNILFTRVTEKFIDIFSKSTFNLVRWYIINKHRRSLEESKTPEAIIWEGCEVSLTDKLVQISIYKNFLKRFSKNPTALRLALAYSNQKKLNSIPLEHFVNLLHSKINYLTRKNAIDNSPLRPLIKENLDGNLTLICKFVLFLTQREVFLTQNSFITRNTKGQQTLSRYIVSNKEFLSWFSDIYDVKDLHKALKHGLIENPLEMLTDHYNHWNTGKEMGDWSFIHDQESIIKRFRLEAL